MPTEAVQVHEIRVRRGIFVVEVDRYRIELSTYRQAGSTRHALEIRSASIPDRRQTGIQSDDPVFPVAAKTAKCKVFQVWKAWELEFPEVSIFALDDELLYLDPSYERITPATQAANRQAVSEIIRKLSRHLSR